LELVLGASEGLREHVFVGKGRDTRASRVYGKSFAARVPIRMTRVTTASTQTGKHFGRAGTRPPLPSGVAAPAPLRPLRLDGFFAGFFPGLADRADPRADMLAAPLRVYGIATIVQTM